MRDRKRRRWRPRFGLRTLLLLILLVALPAARLGLPATEYFGEAPIRQRIEELGGEYSVLQKGSDGAVFAIARWCGVPRIYDRVVRVDLTNTTATKKDIAILSQLSHLESLSLGNTAASDDEVLLLNRCRKLAHIDLRETKITDKAIDHLASMANLKTVDVSHTHLSDACAPALRELSQLKSLDTVGTKISLASLDATLGRRFAFDRIRAEVQRCGGFEMPADGLNIFIIPISEPFDEENVAFAAMKNMNCTWPSACFCLQFSELATDECLDFAAELPRIVSIAANSRKITNRGLAALRTSETLRYLHVFNAAVSPACLETLPPNLDSLILPTSARANVSRSDIPQIRFRTFEPPGFQGNAYGFRIGLSIASDRTVPLYWPRDRHSPRPILDHLSK